MPAQTKQNTKGFLERLNDQSKRVIVTAVILAGAALSAGLGLYNILKDYNPNIIATVNGVNVSKAEFNEKVYSQDFYGTPAAPRSLSETERKEMLDSLVEDKIIEAEAKKLGISVNDSEVTAAIKDRQVPVNTYDELEQEMTDKAVKIDLLKEKIKNKVLGWREGQYVLFRFDKYYNNTNLEFPGKGDQKLIDQQKAYAQDLASRVSSDLAAGKITFDQAIETVKTDPQISAKAMLPVRANIYGDFDKLEFDENGGLFDPTIYKNFKNEVLALKAGETSKPFVLDSVEGQLAYAIVNVSKAGDGTSASYKDWLDSAKKELGVKVYYGNLDIKVKNADFAFSFASKAYACSATYSGTHRTALTVTAYYVNRTGTMVRYPGNSMKLIAGTGDNTDLLKFNSSCGSPTRVHEYNKRAIDSGDLAGQMISDQTYTSQGTDYLPALVDCDATSTAAIYLREDDPVIANTVPNQGSWQLITEYASDSKWLNGAPTEDSAGNFLIKLDLGTSDNWANGTRVYKRAKLFPKWKNKLTVANDPTDGGTITDDQKDISGNPTISCGTDCSQYYDPTSTIKITATPASGYVFKNWTTDSGKTYTSNPLSVNMANAWNITAHYSPVGKTTCSLSAEPTSITQGSSSTITWSTANATSVAAGDPSGWTNKTSVTDNTQTVSPTTTTTYRMKATGTSGTVDCTPVTIEVSTPEAMTLSCSVEPVEGLAPLAVHITTLFSGANQVFSYDMGVAGQQPFANKPKDFYYTYSNSGTYHIKVSNPDYNGGTPKECDTTANVKSTGGGGGNEVTP